jgi:hypothetical protein
MSRQTSEDIAKLKDDYVEYFKDVPVQKYAAMAIGRDEKTIIRWRNEDTDFANRVDQARSAWVRKKVNKTRAEFALERLEKDIFSEKKIIEGGDNPIRILLQAYGIDPVKISEGEIDDGQNDGAISEAPTSEA